MLSRFLPLLACPKCRGQLDLAGDTIRCRSCSVAYPVVFGIPDFRPQEARSIYYDHAGNLAGLARQYDSLSYEQFEEAVSGKATEFQAAYRRAAEQRGDDHWSEAEQLAGGNPVTLRQRALDVGSGPGGNVVSLSKRFETVFGIDVNLELLLLARKRIEEKGLQDRICVLAASADALPFPQDSFDFVTAMNVIEHVEDQLGTLAEVHRVLRKGGALFFDSPNRFTLLPEPHVKLWGVGFLPRSWASPYVKLRKGYGYEGKRLLSLIELRQMLRKNFGKQFQVGLPSFEERAYYPEGRLKKAARAAFNGLFRKTPVVRETLYPFVPTYNVLARK